MFDWLRRRRAEQELVESDARVFIERFGESAYFEARLRQHDDAGIIDANRPPYHWERVKDAIGRMGRDGFPKSQC